MKTKKLKYCCILLLVMEKIRAPPHSFLGWYKRSKIEDGLENYLGEYRKLLSNPQVKYKEELECVEINRPLRLETKAFESSITHYRTFYKSEAKNTRTFPAGCRAAGYGCQGDAGDDDSTTRYWIALVDRDTYDLVRVEEITESDVRMLRADADYLRSSGIDFQTRELVLAKLQHTQTVSRPLADVLKDLETHDKTFVLVSNEMQPWDISKERLTRGKYLLGAADHLAKKFFRHL